MQLSSRAAYQERLFDKLADGVSSPPGAASQNFNLSLGRFSLAETAKSVGFCASGYFCRFPGRKLQESIFAAAESPDAKNAPGTCRRISLSKNFREGRVAQRSCVCRRRKAVKNGHYRKYNPENGASHGEKASNFAKGRSPSARQRFSKKCFPTFWQPETAYTPPGTIIRLKRQRASSTRAHFLGATGCAPLFNCKSDASQPGA